MEVSKDRHSVSVRKTKSELSINSIDDFHFSVSCGSIIICGRGESDNHSQNAVLLINETVPDASRLYKWKSDTDGKGTSILVLSHDGTLSAVSLPSISTSSSSSLSKATSKAEVLWVYSSEKLKQIIGISEARSLPKVNVLSVEQSSASLLIGKHFCRLPEGGNESPPPESWLLSWQHTGITEEDIVNARLQRDFLFTLHTSGNISIFSVNHQKLVAHVNHKHFIRSIFVNAGVLESQETGKPCDFDVSPDLQNIIVTYSNVKYGVYRINLAEYFSHNPKHVLASAKKQEMVQKRKSSKADRDEDELDFTRGVAPVSEKGTPTNRSWWNYLDDLKLKLTKGDDGERIKGVFTSPSANDIKSWQSWFLIADGQLSMVNPRSVSSGQADATDRAHVSGFQRKLQKSPPSGSSTKTGSPAERSPRIETRTDSMVSTAIRTAKLCKGLPVRGVYAGRSSGLVWYGGALQGQSGDRYGGLCFLNFSNNSTQFDRTNPVVHLGRPYSPTPPCLTRSEGPDCSLSMMVYKSAAVTEALCHLNNWDHCSIPIHALEIGLKHRQLDTIAFFLKSRENMFRLKQHTAPVTVASSSHHSDLSSSNDATQLWLAMDLLCLAIAGNIKEMQSKQYALQVLNLALNHLNKLIHNATDSLEHVCRSSSSCLVPSSKRSSQGKASSGTGISPSSSSSSVPSSLESDQPQTAPKAASVVVMTEGFEGTNRDLEDILKKLIGHTVKLRGHLKGAPAWMFPDKDDTDSGGLSPSDTYYSGTDKTMLATMHAWKAMSPQEIIQGAILKRQIPLAQAFLRKQRHHQQLQQTEAQQQALTSLESKGLPLLVDSGLAQVYASLLNAETETAYTMLKNLGFNVTEEIKKICLYTANTGLRDFLITELNLSQDLTKEEADMVHFVHQLEHLYTCLSFEKAKALASEKSKRHEGDKQREEWIPPSDPEAKQYLEDIAVRGDIMVSGEPANCENFNYGHVVLEWVRSWKQETRDRILLERLLASKSKGGLTPPVNYNLSCGIQPGPTSTSHHQGISSKLWIDQSLALILNQDSVFESLCFTDPSINYNLSADSGPHTAAVPTMSSPLGQRSETASVAPFTSQAGFLGDVRIG
eukprot:XP_011670241.1 PREDICTED: spatacsin [Strongylocentrotus purpuratus]